MTAGQIEREIRLVVPEAESEPQAVAAARPRTSPRGQLRIGILDNGKANAGELLKFLADKLKSELRINEVIALRKSHVGVAASDAIMDQLGAKADFVVSAMAE